MLSFRLGLLTSIAILLVFSCAPRKTVSGVKETPDTTRVEKSQEEPPTPGEKVSPPEEEEEEYPALPEGMRRVLGFRVHVFKGPYREAKNLAKELERSTHLKVHLVNDPPYYRVEVGDFLTRDLAESVMHVLLLKGYAESVVVETLVETIEMDYSNKKSR